MALSTQVDAQNSAYYERAFGKKGEDLQRELSSIISNASTMSYGDLWTAYKTTDKRADGKVYDVYSNITNYNFGSNQCGNYTGEGSCYNREHSIPKSWFNDKSPMHNDVIHVIPSDGYINGMRSNYKLAEVGNVSKQSRNGYSKLGTSKTPGISGTVFEPNDEYKGDLARIYFYMATRYKNSVGNWGGGVFSRSFPHMQKASMDMFLKWHKQDPVSKKEIDRNEAVHKSKQKNRNPFVDYPYLVDLIFGGKTNEAFDPNYTSISNNKEADITIFVDGPTVHIGNATLGAKITVYDLTGRILLQSQYTEEDQILTIDHKGMAIISITDNDQYFAKKISL